MARAIFSPTTLPILPPINPKSIHATTNFWFSVTFLGKQNQIEEILSICDLFLMPSETESFGLAALEAMACEVPVISSNAGGLPELSIEGKTGFLCAVGDIKSMAEKSIFILSDDERLQQFKAHAKARAAEFDIHEIVPKYERFYEEIIAKSQKVN